MLSHRQGTTFCAAHDLVHLAYGTVFVLCFSHQVIKQTEMAHVPIWVKARCVCLNEKTSSFFLRRPSLCPGGGAPGRWKSPQGWLLCRGEENVSGLGSGRVPPARSGPPVWSAAPISCQSRGSAWPSVAARAATFLHATARAVFF